MEECTYCKKSITRLHKVGYALKNLFEDHILFVLEMTSIGGGRITDSYWYWEDIMDMSKGKVYFHEGCWDTTFYKGREFAKAKSNLNYDISNSKQSN